MKKILALILAVCCALAAAGCASGSAGNKSAGNNAKTVDDILNQSSDNQPTTGFNFIYGDGASEVVYPELDFEAECDLTKLGSTMVYSEVSAMMTTPDEYMGKTVKASGMFDVFTDPDTGKLYFACIIQDATACCSNGLEFVLDGEYSYPEDYPQKGSAITIGGVFETYTEGEATYCRLKNARIAS